MALGVLSKMLVIDEASFGVYNPAATKKRIELAEDSMSIDLGYTDPETITGVRVKADNIQTRKSAEGSVSIVAAPENGFSKFLKYACGTVTTKSGEFKRERFTNITGTTFTLAEAPVESGTVTVYKKIVGGNWTAQTEDLGATPTGAEYSINLTTGEITMGTALSATDQVMVEYCKTVSGVYSHIFTSGDQPSFQYWNKKGNIELFEYTGCKIDNMTVTINSEDFLKADCDIIAQDEKYGTATGHTYDDSLQLSALDPFIFKQAGVKLDWVTDTMLESIEISIANNLDPKYSIRCDNTVRAITPGKQEFSLNVELEFTDMTYYNKFKNAERGVLEVIYGLCNGVEIGSTGTYYQFQVFVPNFRFETSELPTSSDTMMISAEGFSNLDKGLNYGYQLVLVNSEQTV
ncbi:MAG TPA: phage tail tube protein [Bacteroidales bacterium]|nr:phage tail tube protein [Bacteroidales bacterium]